MHSWVGSPVQANWKGPQTDEAVGMLGQPDWVSIQPHLVQVGSDVVSAVAFAERLVRHRVYVVILQKARGKEHYSLVNYTATSKSQT